MFVSFATQTVFQRLEIAKYGNIENLSINYKIGRGHLKKI